MFCSTIIDHNATVEINTKRSKHLRVPSERENASHKLEIRIDLSFRN
jgi:hypothetical protein